MGKMDTKQTHWRLAPDAASVRNVYDGRGQSEGWRSSDALSANDRVKSCNGCITSQLVGSLDTL